MRGSAQRVRNIPRDCLSIGARMSEERLGGHLEMDSGGQSPCYTAEGAATRSPLAERAAVGIGAECGQRRLTIGAYDTNPAVLREVTSMPRTSLDVEPL